MGNELYWNDPLLPTPCCSSLYFFAVGVGAGSGVAIIAVAILILIVLGLIC